MPSSVPTPAGNTFARLLGYARPYVGIVALALLLSLGYTGGRYLRAWLIKPLLDEVLLAEPAEGALPFSGSIPFLGGGEAEAGEHPVAAPKVAVPEPERRARLATQVEKSLWRILWLGLAVVALMPLTHFGKEYLAQYALGRVLVDIQQELCAKLLVLPLRFHQRMRRGETLTRTLADVTRSQRALRLVLGDIVPSLLALVVGTALLVTISWQLTLCFLLIAPFVVGVIAVFGGRIRKTARRRQETLGNVTQRLVEILSGIKVIKAFRAERAEELAFRRENRRLFRRSMKVVKNRVLSRTIVEGLTNSLVVAILPLGAILVLRGQWGLSAGDLAAFATVTMTTYRPIKDLTKGWGQLMDALPSAERFFELLDERPGVEEASDAQSLEGVKRGVRFRNVTFAYDREPVLRDVSLDVAAGEVCAIVGRTGAGKTTLADLLLRFYDPDSGSIEIDGIDLRRIRRDSLLEHVAVVTQEPFLFGGTIRDNIRYGRPDATDAEIEAAARTAHLDEFVDGLADGWDTEVGELGVKLSGGQRQRITIARAILKNPAVLIFDEATSSLDAKSERYVQDAIERLMKGRTVFVIAHRLSTIRRADKIAVLEEGTVAAIGTHAELTARAGLYRELVSLQTESI